MTVIADGATVALAWLSGLRLRQLLTLKQSYRQVDPDIPPTADIDQPDPITTEID
ncbi:hypothetical protein [Synechococcus sp. HK01-R]|uniref:hypothetical protein n=1 Tax=Synechococcus sp. HK01-R TaxID=2751171 RepID=UPI00162916FB|nr:hypothetical protein [Synechococcus sp. HK01-R]QNG26570.1 hypothetical protein H0O21_09985 [Synechococcus sp. HK01-R]